MPRVKSAIRTFGYPSVFRIRATADARRVQSAAWASRWRRSGAREAVVLRASRVGCLTPFGFEPSSALQTIQRGEQRARVDLEHTPRDLLDPAGDAEPVHRLEAQRFEDEHVERALNDVGFGSVHRGLDDERFEATIPALHLDCQDVEGKRCGGNKAPSIPQ